MANEKTIFKGDALQLLIDFGGVAHGLDYLKGKVCELGDAEGESLREALDCLDDAMFALSKVVTRIHDAAYDHDGEGEAK